MQQPGSLDSRVLLRQLRSTGARELVQVSRASHQARLPLSLSLLVPSISPYLSLYLPISPYISLHQVRLPLAALWPKLAPLQPQLERLLPHLPPMSATAQSYAAEVQKA